jgi:hypothetical protein
VLLAAGGFEHNAEMRRDFGVPGNEGITIDLRLSHQAIAEAIGSTRVTITRLLGDLRNAGLGSAILMKSDSRELYRLAIGCGMVPLVEQAAEMVRQGKTSPAEVRRVLGSGMRT